MGQHAPAASREVDGAQIKRSYSIASAPDGSPRFEIAVTRVQGGPGSTLAPRREPGRRCCRFIGPQGFFTRPAPASDSRRRSWSRPAPASRRCAACSAQPPRPARAARVAPSRRAARRGHALRGRVSRARSRAPFFRFEPTLSQPRGAWDGPARLRADPRRASCGTSSRPRRGRAARVRLRPRAHGGLGARPAPQGDGAAAAAGAQRAVRLKALPFGVQPLALDVQPRLDGPHGHLIVPTAILARPARAL